MQIGRDNPCIVQSDSTILVEAHHPQYENARDFLARFAELIKSPEHIHVYRITPLSLWNAAASGMKSAEIIQNLKSLSKYEVPKNIEREIEDYVSRYGRLKLKKAEDGLILESEERYLMEEIAHHKQIQPWLRYRIDPHAFAVDIANRGIIKQELLKIGFPVEDLAGYVTGTSLAVQLRPVTAAGKPFQIRPYQRNAIDIFHADGQLQGGNGVIVLPCGAGKTIVGIGIMDKLCCETLILVTSITAGRQWTAELLDKTSLAASDIGEYSGEKKEIRPVTIATYNILTQRKNKEDEFTHFALFDQRHWGLIIYDEVHLLPAPVFRITSLIQAKRRLGLTATLIREDGLEGDVFSLIGPKKYDAPWKDMERQGWIATAQCYEIRVNLESSLQMAYATAEAKDKFRIASENLVKDKLVKRLLARHPDDHILVIGQYLDQLTRLAREFQAPLITGKTKNQERMKLYDAFKSGDIRVLVVSKVANFAIDLPDANVAIQVSGTFGSRQEEAQRLGRILRPKSSGVTAHFYSLVTRETKDQEFAEKRQLFLTEQGYKYLIWDEQELESH